MYIVDHAVAVIVAAVERLGRVDSELAGKEGVVETCVPHRHRHRSGASKGGGGRLAFGPDVRLGMGGIVEPGAQRR
jgi:hypothetical protein